VRATRQQYEHPAEEEGHQAAPRCASNPLALCGLSGLKALSLTQELCLPLLAEHAIRLELAYASATSRDFFSARMGCQTFQPVYGIDLAALCTRR
jgi:hypothetical protein